MLEKVDALAEMAQWVVLKIRQEKTIVLRSNSIYDDLIFIEGIALEDVGKVVCLGSKISQSGGEDEGINARIRKAVKSLLSQT
uniref:Uncharacterized protein n=1 Tax=Arion vulgaris TaxID=1028688 RepID=A0A0B7BFV7_9EUPU